MVVSSLMSNICYVWWDDPLALTNEKGRPEWWGVKGRADGTQQTGLCCRVRTDLPCQGSAARRTEASLERSKLSKTWPKLDSELRAGCLIVCSMCVRDWTIAMGCHPFAGLVCPAMGSALFGFLVHVVVCHFLGRVVPIYTNARWVNRTPASKLTFDYFELCFPIAF